MTGVAIESLTMIGFDVRRAPGADNDLLLPPERRRGSLLDPDTPLLLTADRTIWPSIFHAKDSYDHALIRFGDDDVLIESAPETRYFAAVDLWEDLAKMHAAYRKASVGDCGVAFALLKPDYYVAEFKTDSWFDALDAPGGVEPPEPGSDWPFLGFDVVNSGFQSAVSGFGPLVEIDTLRTEWAKDMNVFHLFDDRARALEFCADANDRIADDGPFFVLALFLLWDTNGAVAPKAKSIQPKPQS